MTDPTRDERLPAVKPECLPVATGRAYTRGERVADAVMHALGVGGALVAVPVLVTLAAVWHGDMPVVTAAVIYGVSFIAMFAASASYHLLALPRWKDVLRRLDHAAIYMKIAGTYTPFAVMFGAGAAPGILGALWGAAAIGTALKLLAPDRFEWLSLGLYLAMGWAIVLIGGPILDGIATATFVLVLVGGGLYTLGVVFHLWDSLPFQNAIWHGHVLAASFVFYAAVLIEVARTAPPA